MMDSKTNKIFIGIDPGIGGGIAILKTNGNVTILPTPKHDRDRANILRDCTHDSTETSLIVYERVHSIHGASAKSNFIFGGEYRSWKTIAEVLGIPLAEVTPAAWQAAMLEGKPKRPSVKELNLLLKPYLNKRGKLTALANVSREDRERIEGLFKKKRGMLDRHKKAIKSYAAEVAQHLYPDLQFKRTPRCTTIDDGMVDALLIAEYGRRYL